jgi:hypothetical protein
MFHLNVQDFLQSKTHDQLTEEFGIKVNHHDTLPLVILNYDQIESPKTNPIVRECRGLLLHSETHEIVARSFPRFFNWGEVADEMDDFDFSDFVVQSKEDGSLVLIYHFDGQWRANTRGSFAQDPMQYQEFTWTEGFCRAMGINSLNELDGKLVEGVTYVCEFCSPWNKVVRTYSMPKMHLLSAFRGFDEIPVDEVDTMVSDFFIRPNLYNFDSLESIQKFLREQEQSDPTFEGVGVVIMDWSGKRWKIKSATYLGLHRLKGEGDNMFNPKHLLPFILAGEEDELLTYFPEVAETFYKVKSNVLKQYSQLLEVWADHKDIEDQKEFALSIQGKTPYTGILFSLRKGTEEDQKSHHVRELWRNAEKYIIKNIV